MQLLVSIEDSNFAAALLAQRVLRTPEYAFCGRVLDRDSDYGRCTASRISNYMSHFATRLLLAAGVRLWHHRLIYLADAESCRQRIPSKYGAAMHRTQTSVQYTTS